MSALPHAISEELGATNPYHSADDAEQANPSLNCPFPAFLSFVGCKIQVADSVDAADRRMDAVDLEVVNVLSADVDTGERALG